MLDQPAPLGAEATGEVGHKDPVEAARDAMRGPSGRRGRSSRPLPSGISRWLGQDAPTRLTAAVPVPVVVVHRGAGQEPVRMRAEAGRRRRAPWPPGSATVRG